MENDSIVERTFMGYLVLVAVVFAVLVAAAWLWDKRDSSANTQKVRLLEEVQKEADVNSKDIENLKMENQYLHGAIDGLMKRAEETDKKVAEAKAQADTADFTATSALKSSGKSQRVKVQVETLKIEIVRPPKKAKPLLPHDRVTPPSTGTHDTVGARGSATSTPGGHLAGGKKSLLVQAGVSV